MEDIITILNLILLICAVLIFWRLRSVLGTREDSDPRGRDFFKEKKAKPAKKQVLRVITEGEKAEAVAGLEQITRAEEGFDGTQVLKGAMQAYEVILQAYARHDRDTLKPLVSDEVFLAFDEAMKVREGQKQSLEINIIRLDNPTIEDASLKDNTAQITVKIVCDLASVLRDEEGKTIEGSAQTPIQNTDLWVFARPINSKNPNWLLVATS